MTFLESRLIGYTLEEINRQRIAVGATPVTSAANPTGQQTQTTVTANALAAPTTNAAKLGTAAYEYYGNDVKTNVSMPTQWDSSGNIIPSPYVNSNNQGIAPTLINPTNVGMTDEQIRLRDLAQQNTDQANQDLARQGFSGSNTLYNPSLTAEQNAANQAVATKAGSTQGAGSTILSPMQTRKAMRESQIAAVDIKRQVQVGTDKNGKAIFQMRTDDVATQAAKDALMKKFMQEDQMAADRQKQKLSQQRFSAGAPVTATNTANTDSPKNAPVPVVLRGPDFSSFDEQTSVINAMIQQDPHLASAYIPQLMGLIQRRTALENSFNNSVAEFNQQDMNNNGVSDGVESQVASSQAALIARDAKEQAIAKENMQINLDAANFAKELAQIGQAKFELQQKHNEQLVLDNNIEMERKNRLIANRLGIQNDTNGLKWMQEEVRKGVETLAFLQESGTLQQAEFNLQIGKQYALNVRQATNQYDSQRLQLDSQFSNDMANLNKIVTLDAKERRDERKSMTKDYLEALDKNDTKFYEQVKEFNKTMQSNIEAKLKETKANSMSAKDKLGFVSNLRSGIQQNKTITQANDVDGFYGALQGAYSVYKSQIEDPTNTESLNAAQTAVIGSFARILDPGSVVRNEEYERQVYGQSWVNTVAGLFDKARRGGTGMTPADIESMKKVADQIHVGWESRLQTSMQPFILDIQDWNKNYPDAQIDFAQVIPVDRIHLPEQKMETWGGQAPEGWAGSGGQQSFDPTSLGTVTQGFDGTYTKGANGKHNALDIANAEGTPIPAIISGTVRVKKDGPLGNHVIIEGENGETVTLGHMKGFEVKDGQKVRSGDIVGLMGHTGNTSRDIEKGGKRTGSHVHIEVRDKGGKLVDPMAYFKGGTTVAQGSMSDSELMGILRQAGFEGDGLRTAFAVAKAESGGRAGAYNGNTKTGDDSYGLFQINMLGDLGTNRKKKFSLKSNEELYDPVKNAQIAYVMSGGGKNWQPWSAYKNGSYEQYMNLDVGGYPSDYEDIHFEHVGISDDPIAIDDSGVQPSGEWSENRKNAMTLLAGFQGIGSDFFSTLSNSGKDVARKWRQMQGTTTREDVNYLSSTR